MMLLTKLQIDISDISEEYQSLQISTKLYNMHLPKNMSFSHEYDFSFIFFIILTRLDAKIVKGILVGVVLVVNDKISVQHAKLKSRYTSLIYELLYYYKKV